MIFANLFKIIPEPFGLDISDSSFKVVKLSKHRNRLVLEGFGSHDIHEGLMEDGVILEEDKLAEVIREGMEKIKNWPSGLRYVSCSLPEQKTYLRIMQLPKMGSEEIRDALMWEIEANVPIAVEEAYYDWEIISLANKKKEAELDHIDVLVSVAPKAIVDSYTRMLEKAGLKAYSFESESMALARGLIKRGFSQQPILIIDLGQTRTSFIIYTGYALRFATSVKISGNALTDVIMREFKADRKEAEKLKLEIGLDKDKDPKIFESVIPVIKELEEQAGQYIDFYTEHSSHVHGNNEGISKIILAGGGSSLKGLEKYLALNLNIPVELGNPWINIIEGELTKIPELAFEDSLRYCTVLGLALNQLNNNER